jgi:hypothetical protein
LKWIALYSPSYGDFDCFFVGSSKSGAKITFIAKRE